MFLGRGSLAEKTRNGEELIELTNKWRTLRHSTFTVQTMLSRQRLHCSRDIWERSFISTVSPTTLIRQKRSFVKTLSKPRKFENAGFTFSCGRKTFSKKWSFSQTMTSRKSRDFRNRVSSNPNDRWLVRFEIPPAQCDRNWFFFLRFHRETSVSKFLRRSVSSVRYLNKQTDNL